MSRKLFSIYTIIIIREEDIEEVWNVVVGDVVLYSTYIVCGFGCSSLIINPNNKSMSLVRMKYEIWTMIHDASY